MSMNRWMVGTLLLPVVVGFLVCAAVPTRADDKPGGKDQAKHPQDASEAKPVKKVTVEEFDKKRAEKETVVLDVRTAEEYATGHVPGAVNLDVHGKEFKEKVEKLDKSKTYLVHCARGGRSALAAATMSDLGFKNLFDFSGGMNAWKKSGKPVEKGAPQEKQSSKDTDSK